MHGLARPGRSSQARRRGDSEGQYGLTAVPLDKAKADATSLRSAPRRGDYRSCEGAAVEL